MVIGHALRGQVEAESIAVSQHQGVRKVDIQEATDSLRAVSLAAAALGVAPVTVEVCPAARTGQLIWNVATPLSGEALQRISAQVTGLPVPDYAVTGTDPASLSPAAYALLRSGDYSGQPFDGLFFTDDLSSMAAINQRYRVADAALLALRAGADVALWITTDQVPAVLDRLEQAVNAGDLPQARVDDALRHVATAKGPKLGCAG